MRGLPGNGVRFFTSPRQIQTRNMLISMVLILFVIGAYLTCAAFIAAGIWLVWFGATGNTSFTIFGQQFASTNVGIAALFLGAVTVVLLLRRFLKSFDDSLKSDHTSQLNDDVWPKTQNLQTLREAVRSLSSNKFKALVEVERYPGIALHELVERMGYFPSEGANRLSVLERMELVVEMSGDRLKLHPNVKNLLRGKKLSSIRGRISNVEPLPADVDSNPALSDDEGPPGNAS
jgi:hypothetical protein